MTTPARPSLDLYDSWADCVADFEPGHIPAATMWLLDREPEVSREYCAALTKAVETVADTSQPAPDGLVRADSYFVTEDQVVIGFIQLRMDQAKAEVLAFTGFPWAHWRKIWSTNPLERVNKEIKRRSRVVGTFPNSAAVIRLVGAILIDMHDEWIAGDRRYLSEASMAKLYDLSDTGDTASINSGE